MKYLVFTVLLLVTIIISAGCTTTTNQPATVAPSPTDALTLLETPTPTDEVTFTAPEYQPGLIAPQPAVITQPQTPATSDPVIGQWQAVGAPYSCTVFFAQDGSGSATCGEFGIPIQSQRFSWTNQGTDGNGGTSYMINIPNADQSVPAQSILADLNSSGDMSASILPSNAYLVKTI